MTALQRHFAELTKAFGANGDAFVPATALAKGEAPSLTKGDTTDWKTKFSDVEFDLAGILGGGGTLPTDSVGTSKAPESVPILIRPGTAPEAGASGEVSPAGAVATTGAVATMGSVSGSAIAAGIGVSNLDPNVRRQLEQFRTQLELFFASSVMGVAGSARP